MSEPAEGTASAARLNELAAVTREYAHFSHTYSGLAKAAFGAWCVAVVVVALRSTTWGRIAGLWSPIFAVCALAAAKAYYQRFGRVDEVAPRAVRDRSRRIEQVFTWTSALLASHVIVMTATHLDAWSGGDRYAYWALALAPGSLPVVFMLATRLKLRMLNSGISILSVMMVAEGARLADGAAGPVDRVNRLVLIGGLGLMGALFGAVGIDEHVKYRRLERRLAALKARV